MIPVKTAGEISLMEEGGKRLTEIKNRLFEMVRPGITPLEIDKEAEKLIKETGGQSSFKKVKGYRWTTCININEGVVHGIPTTIPFKTKDLVSVDVGMFYQGFHTDTSFSVALNPTREVTAFLAAGKEALNASIKEARVGNRISHISHKMQEVLEKHKLNPVRALIGHGVGKSLHEEPQIPCFWERPLSEGELIPLRAVLAIEVIYTLGKPDLELASDDWTIATKDGKIAGLFEETVAVLPDGPRVLTA